MSKNPGLRLRWPMAGLDRRYGFQSQPPFTTPDCLNVWPDGAIAGRQRGGSRPGLSKAFVTELGGGSRINMLVDVEINNASGVTFWEDNFEGGLAAWTGVTVDSFTGLPQTTPTYLTPRHVAGLQRRAAVRGDIDINLEGVYFISIVVVPQGGQFRSDFFLFGLMDDTTPDHTTKGVKFQVRLRGSGNYEGVVEVEGMASNNGSYAISNCNTGAAVVTVITLKVDPVNNTVEPFIQGESVMGALNVGAIASDGHAFGFGIDANESGAIGYVDRIRITYNADPGSTRNRSILVAASAGDLYRENTLDEMSQVSTSTTLSSTALLQAADRGGKLYIADHSEAADVRRADAAVQGTPFTKVRADTGNFDWATAGVNTADFIARLSQTRGGTGEDDGIYQITAVDAAGGGAPYEFTISPAAGASGNCIVEILRAPKVYDPIAGTLQKLQPQGSARVPGSCPFVARYRDRIVWGFGTEVFMSAVGDPLDYNYAATVSTRAVALAATDAGDLPNNITALVAFSDDYLIIACRDEMYILTGDPTLFTGILNNVSYSVGIVDKLAWCPLPDGSLCFLAQDGLYRLPPGGQGKPIAMSHDRLPEDLRDFDTTTFNMILAYDARHRAIKIAVTRKTGTGLGRLWHFDMDGGSFWPESYSSDNEPVAMSWHSSDSASDSSVVLGGRDGYIRRHVRGQPTDDGTAFDNYVLIGPFMPGRGPLLEGAITRASLTMAISSGDVTMSILADDTAEEAVGGLAKYTATFGEGDNGMVRPRVRGVAALIKIAGQSGSIWALENIGIVSMSLGQHRKDT